MKRFLATSITVATLACALALAAQAATYNFYFNNTEQGDNSTAAPTVTVGDGKVEKKPAVPTTPPAATQPEPAHGEAPAPVAPSARSEAVVSEAGDSRVAPFGSDRTAHFRLSAGAGGVLEGSADFGPFVDLGLFANRYVGIDLYGGSSPVHYSDNRPGLVLGAELELTPVHLGTSSHPDIFEFGLLAGASNVYAADSNVVSPHIGARLSVNFGNYVALTGALRGNVGYALVEGGIALRL